MGWAWSDFVLLLLFVVWFWLLSVGVDGWVFLFVGWLVLLLLLLLFLCVVVVFGGGDCGQVASLHFEPFADCR